MADLEKVTLMTEIPTVTGASAGQPAGVNTSCTVSAPRPALTWFNAVTVTVWLVGLARVIRVLVVLHW